MLGNDGGPAGLESGTRGKHTGVARRDGVIDEGLRQRCLERCEQSSEQRTPSPVEVKEGGLRHDGVIHATDDVPREPRVQKLAEGETPTLDELNDAREFFGAAF